jgi:hypothetical protein
MQKLGSVYKRSNMGPVSLSVFIIFNVSNQSADGILISAIVSNFFSFLTLRMPKRHSQAFVQTQNAGRMIATGDSSKNTRIQIWKEEQMESIVARDWAELSTFIVSPWPICTMI